MITCRSQLPPTLAWALCRRLPHRVLRLVGAVVGWKVAGGSPVSEHGVVILALALRMLTVAMALASVQPWGRAFPAWMLAHARPGGTSEKKAKDQRRDDAEAAAREGQERDQEHRGRWGGGLQDMGTDAAAYLTKIGEASVAGSARPGGNGPGIGPADGGGFESGMILGTGVFAWAAGRATRSLVKKWRGS